jgi:hypothetical protein
MPPDFCSGRDVLEPRVALRARVPEVEELASTVGRLAGVDTRGAMDDALSPARRDAADLPSRSEIASWPLAARVERPPAWIFRPEWTDVFAD